MFSINNRTFLAILGLILFGGGVVALASLVLPSDVVYSARLIGNMREWITFQFGPLAFLFPIIIILVSSHFFSTKKMQLVKWNITIGLTLLYISLLGLFQGGEWGRAIRINLSLDLTPVVTIIVLVVIFIIGIMLFLDTSVDVFIHFCINSLQSLRGTFQKMFVRAPAPSAKKESKALRSSAPEYISDDKEVSKTKKEYPSDKLAPPIETEDDRFIRDRKISQSEAKGEKKPIYISGQAKKQQTTDSAHKLKMKDVSVEQNANWVYPPISLLSDIKQSEADRGDVKKNADIIEKTLDSFGIRARVAEVNKGPTVTQYAIEITMGTKLSKITALGNDLALALAAPTGQVRIEAPIPGRSLVGIEIPNIRAEIVTLKRLLSSGPFAKDEDPLLVPLGLDVSGLPRVASIGKMPHVLVAGTTGSGKSVMLNAWIATMLFRTKPEQLRVIMVDPKRVELAVYNGVPHLMSEVIVEPQKILAALQWTVGEMENRYKEFANLGVRNLAGYNSLKGIEKKPYIVFIIDELADLMMFASREAEDLITRIAQMARATGIHLVLATQRPSVDVITGLMKANIPARLAFNVSSMIDSRVVLDAPGAEKLLGKGDMLYLGSDQAKPHRIQGAFLTDKEVTEVVRFLKDQVPAVEYTEEITSKEVPVGGKGSVALGATSGGDGNDPLFQQAVELISQMDKASSSLIQRKLKVGYARAARLLDELEEAGYVGPAEGSKPREVLRRGTEIGLEETIEE